MQKDTLLFLQANEQNNSVTILHEKKFSTYSRMDIMILTLDTLATLKCHNRLAFHTYLFSWLWCALLIVKVSE